MMNIQEITRISNNQFKIQGVILRDETVVYFVFKGNKKQFIINAHKLNAGFNDDELCKLQAEKTSLTDEEIKELLQVCMKLELGVKKIDSMFETIEQLLSNDNSCCCCNCDCCCKEDDDEEDDCNLYGLDPNLLRFLQALR